MLYRLFGLMIAIASVVGYGGGARSSTLPHATAGPAAVAMECAATCAGGLSVKSATGSLAAKVSDGAPSALIAKLATSLAISAPANSAAPSSIVASVELQLRPYQVEPQPNMIPANTPAGAVAQLLITARDSAGKAILNPGPYLNAHGKPLVILIANSSPGNTSLSSMGFAEPSPSQGASNVATVYYSGRAHFHFPTFSVANPELNASPREGVTLTYAPVQGPDTIDGLSPCFSGPSVGGYYFGGPYVGLAHATGSCVVKDVADADLLQIIQVQPSLVYVKYQLRSKHDGDVALGFGSDKKVYFAYNSGSTSPTVFGYLHNLSALAARHRLSNMTVKAADVAPLSQIWANVSSVSQLTLGNDSSLWFHGVWNKVPMIGKLPPAGAPNWAPEFYPIRGASSILSIAPGIGNSEAVLYTAHGAFYVGIIGTNLTGFKSVRVLTNANPNSGIVVGDLFAARDGNFYVSAQLNKSAAQGGFDNVYKITNSGQLNVFCHDVAHVYRLRDGTGVGADFDSTGDDHLVHFVPAVGCATIPKLSKADEFIPLEGVDTTTDDWIIYSDPSGHRLGIF